MPNYGQSFSLQTLAVRCVKSSIDKAPYVSRPNFMMKSSDSIMSRQEAVLSMRHPNIETPDKQKYKSMHNERDNCLPNNRISGAKSNGLTQTCGRTSKPQSSDYWCPWTMVRLFLTKTTLDGYQASNHGLELGLGPHKMNSGYKLAFESTALELVLTIVQALRTAACMVWAGW